MHDLLDEKFDTKEIVEIINGNGHLGPIISGELDVDRMDYLLRDSHNTGVAYGVHLHFGAYSGYPIGYGSGGNSFNSMALYS